jgi:hypothetical protein
VRAGGSVRVDPGVELVGGLGVVDGLDAVLSGVVVGGVGVGRGGHAGGLVGGSGSGLLGD